MFRINNQFNKGVFDNKEIFSSGRVGIEKESLRIKNSKISDTTHQLRLGSPLCNKYITTDFSEALVELITPPYKNKEETHKFLEDIHHYVYSNIDNELLWPLSMPLHVEDINHIPIATYGTSNLAKLKYFYRKGLLNRYGSMMQIISGAHFNYSLPECIWDKEFFTSNEKSLRDIKSEVYFAALRNIKRKNWLIIYLFGSSPIIPESLLPKDSTGFKKISKKYYYLDYATSLRMSDLGYVSPFQENISVSLNSANQYVSDLFAATQTTSEKFRLIPLHTEGEILQINENILQLEDEYYSEARPKNDSSDHIRMLNKIKNFGINYLELRSLDLNPFDRSGIDKDTIYFMELFTLYCLFKESPKIDNLEEENIKENNLLVTREGRRKDISLIRFGEKISLKNWGSLILNDISSLAEKLDLSNDCYKSALKNAENKLNNLFETPSNLILDILSQESSLEDYVLTLAKKHKDTFHNHKNYSFDLLKKESKESLEKQLILEGKSHQPFEKYLKNYLDNAQ